MSPGGSPAVNARSGNARAVRGGSLEVHVARPTIRGSVILDGERVPGARVRLLGPAGELVSEQRTGDDGSFSFRVVAGSWILDVGADGASRALVAVPVRRAVSSAIVTLRRTPRVVRRSSA